MVLLIQSVELKPGMNEFAALGTNYVYLLRNLIGTFYVLARFVRGFGFTSLN